MAIVHFVKHKRTQTVGGLNGVLNYCCKASNKENIQIILSAVTELITEAILRSTAEEDDLEPAA